MNSARASAALRSDEDLKIMKRRQAAFVSAVRGGKHLEMSEANKAFHMAIADAGKNIYLAAFYDRLLNQGRRMLNLHFRFLETERGGYLLTDEHDQMLEAIRARDVERADRLAHAHTRQFQDNFIEFMKHNYLKNVQMPAPKPAV